MVRAMLRLLALAAMFALAPTLALAQQSKDEHKGPPPHPSGGPPPPHPAFKPAPPHPAFKPAPPHPAFKPAPGPVGGGLPHPPGPPPGPVGGPPPHPLGGPVFAHPGGPPPGGPQFSYHGHPFNRVHINPFIYPPGWAYRQWAIGAFLPPLFLTPYYYYPDWAALGLPPPPPGDQWVRYGPDLLLVDTTTGQVIDVAYGVFYEGP
jgi:hypothetical protein